MKLKILLERVSVPLLLVVSLCACSRFIEGDVFLDKNANNIRDTGEGSIPGLRFTMTRDNAAQQSGVTDEFGHFWVPMGINEIGGNYCVQVRSEDVSALKLVSGNEVKTLNAAKTLESDPDASSDVCPYILGLPDCDNENCCDKDHCSDAAICEDKCAKNSDGDPDCSDEDCCDQSECSEASACQEESDKNACPKDDAGQPQCSDSRCAKETACDTYTVKSMQACDESKAAKLTLRLDVPVAMDYATRVTTIEAVTHDPVKVGDSISADITYPSSCTFETYILPAAFSPIGLGDAYNPITRELFLSRAIRNQPWQVITKDAPPFGHDSLYTYVLRLQVAGEEGFNDGKVEIRPVLTCPDGKKVSARAVVIPLKSDTDLTLSPVSPPEIQVQE